MRISFESCERVGDVVYKVRATRVGIFRKKPLLFMMHYNGAATECFRMPGWKVAEPGEWLAVNSYIQAQHALRKSAPAATTKPSDAL
jgi:hypothetical protein